MNNCLYIELYGTQSFLFPFMAFLWTGAITCAQYFDALICFQVY